MSVQILHNPQCSKSRAALSLLIDRGCSVEVIDYRNDPPDAARLDWILTQLQLEPREFMRRDEPVYAQLGLDDPKFDRAALIAAMLAHPVLIQRPVVINGQRVALGRPVENILEVL